MVVFWIVLSVVVFNILLLCHFLLDELAEYLTACNQTADELEKLLDE